MDFPANKIEHYAQAYRIREERRREACRARAKVVLRRLPELATVLKRDYGVRRFGYFGSLRSEELHETSDVDLYVDQIRSDRYFEALDKLWRALELPVDLIELERSDNSLRECIQREGIDIA